MGLAFACSKCGREIFVRRLAIGEPAHCKSCGTLTPVPSNASLAECPGAVEPARQSSVPKAPIASFLTTTAFEIPGYRVVRNLGVVRGLMVRSRSVLGDIGAQVESMVGGKVTVYIRLCEETRAEAYDLMLRSAEETGANAVLGIRFDANAVADGITEVLCYGTAVLVASLATNGQ